MKRKGLFAAVSFFVALAFAVRTAFFDANSVYASKLVHPSNTKNDYDIALDLLKSRILDKIPSEQNEPLAMSAPVTKPGASLDNANPSNPKTLVVKDTLAMASGLDVPSDVLYSDFPSYPSAPSNPLSAAVSSAWDSVSSAWDSLLNFVADFFIPATPSVPSVTVNNNAGAPSSPSTPAAPSNTTNTTNVTVQPAPSQPASLSNPPVVQNVTEVQNYTGISPQELNTCIAALNLSYAQQLAAVEAQNQAALNAQASSATRSMGIIASSVGCNSYVSNGSVVCGPVQTTTGSFSDCVSVGSTLNVGGSTTLNILDVTGLSTLGCLSAGTTTVSGSVTAGSLSVAGGTQNEFLKADGSLDCNVYLTANSASTTYVPYTGATADLNLGCCNLCTTGNVCAGNVCANVFYGDGSHLTGISLCGGIVLWDRNATTSTLTAHNVNDNLDLGSGNLSVAGTSTLGTLSAGIATLSNLVVTSPATSTFAGSVSAAAFYGNGSGLTNLCVTNDCQLANGCGYLQSYTETDPVFTSWRNGTSLAAGNGALATGCYSYALGASSTASGYGSTAIGRCASATATSSIALGRCASATATSSMALGYAACASSGRSTALGCSATASGYRSTALGGNATASGYRSAAFGSNASASCCSSTAFGYASTASGYGATAVGPSSFSLGFAATSLGYTATASGCYSMSIGNDSSALSCYSTALGYCATSSGCASTALGFGATASHPDELSFSTSNGSGLPKTQLDIYNNVANFEGNAVCTTGTLAAGTSTLTGLNVTGTATSTFAGNVCAASFYGDGSHLTGLAGGSIELWSRDATTSTLTAYNPNDNVDLGSGNLTGTGNVCASAFYGDGSHLTGIGGGGGMSTSTTRGLFSAVGPVTYSATSGAIGFTNPGYVCNISGQSLASATNDAGFICLSSLSGTGPISYDSTSGVISFVNPGYICNIANQCLSTACNDAGFITAASTSAAYVPYTGATGAVNLGVNNLCTAGTLAAGTTTISGSVTAGSFSGNGTGLTNLCITNDSQLGNGCGYLQSYTETDPFFTAWCGGNFLAAGFGATASGITPVQSLWATTPPPPLSSRGSTAFRSCSAASGTCPLR